MSVHKNTGRRAGTSTARNNTANKGHDTAHEPSAWLHRQIADIMRQARREAWPIAPGIIHAVAIRDAVTGSREDFTCDRCRAYVADHADFTAMSVSPCPGLIVTFGLCRDCYRKEMGL